jgi:hypothetical protein
MRRAREVAEYHAEAVIERHGDADPVHLRVATTFANEIAVVQNVVVTQRGALRVSRRATRVLNVDRVVELQRHFASAHGIVRRGRGGCEEIGPALGSEEHDPFERRDVWSHGVDHRDVVARFVAGCREEQPALRLSEGVVDLLRAIGRVEIDENRANPRGGVLDQHPLRVVRAPDADPIAGVDPNRQEAPGKHIDL